jgi:hypothetical protein
MRGFSYGALVNWLCENKLKPAALDLGALADALPGGSSGPHTHPASDISDSTAVGRALLIAANEAAARAAIGAGTSSFSGDYNALTNKPSLFDGTWGSLSGKPATFPPDTHNHDAAYEPKNTNIQAHVGSIANPHGVTKAQVGLGNCDNTSDAAKPVSTATQTALDGKSGTGHDHSGVYEPANANIQQHVAAAHAPANAQKNSDILKAEIEAKLTGEISTHTHAGGGGSPFMFEGSLAADAATGANVTPISLTGLVFTFEANSRYWIEFQGAVRAAAATTGSGFQLDTSVAVTRVGVGFNHQLANTGTVSGGSSIADDASVGVSSGRPSANVDTPTFGTAYLITGASGGTAQLRYRSEVAAVSTVMAGFMMRVRKQP